MTELLHGGRALTEWILRGGAPERAAFAHAPRLRWHAYWFELNWRSSAARLESRPLPTEPVFIVGPWRSGTTALHELISTATAWPTPRTWHCFNPSTCFLVKAAPREAMVPRPMDAGIIGSHSPQEDEFAILLLGEASAYRGFIDPRRLPECAAQLFGTDGTAASASTLPRWQTFLRGITTETAPHLLLKSPNHTFRMRMLRQCFPRARFIWMGRRSREVLASNLKMWRAMMERYALWSCPPGVLEEFLQQALRACTATLQYCLQELSPEQLLWLDFDEFRTDTERMLGAVLEFLRVDLGTAANREQCIRRALQQTPVHAGSRVLAPPDPAAEELDALAARARQRFGPFVARH